MTMITLLSMLSNLIIGGAAVEARTEAAAAFVLAHGHYRILNHPTSTTTSTLMAPSINRPLPIISTAIRLNMQQPSEDDDSNNNNNNNEADKLRSLQIAYEFERVQSTLPDPLEVQRELQEKFDISTKYFLGYKEMAYALAVARVDDRMERHSQLLSDLSGVLSVGSDGCLIDEDGNPISKSSDSTNDDGSDSSNGNAKGEVQECMTEQDLLISIPTPEELVAMEYTNLYESWSEGDLSSELENQYGIPAKHFRGKREMAYALAVERVDRAMKEGGMIVDDEDEEYNNSYGIESEVEAEGESLLGYNNNNNDAVSKSMTEEDMMRLMEEEMRLEMLEEEQEEEERQRRLAVELELEAQSSQPAGQSTPFQGETIGVSTTTNNSVRDTPNSRRNGDTLPSSKKKKTFQKPDPNPFQKKPAQQPSYQSTPLADMIKDEKNDRSSRNRSRNNKVERTPLSSEPPHSFASSRRQRQEQHRRNSVQMGTVIGEGEVKNKESKSLTDILKGSERQKSQQRGQQRSQQQQQRVTQRQGGGAMDGNQFASVPPTQKTFKTTSSRFDDSFHMGGGIGNKGYGNVGATVSANSRGYTTSWGSAGPTIVSNNNINNGGATVRGGNDRGYSSSWNGPRPHEAASAAAASGTSRSRSNTATQRPFEPAPFTEPGTHNASRNKSRSSSNASANSSGSGNPKRVPPQTPFSSPVTDGWSTTRINTNGPFTPFTAPGKRSTNGKPPPRKRPLDPRGFNIKDTPDNTQPFVGSQSFDFGGGGPGNNNNAYAAYAAYSPPLQVEPPPRDPNYEEARERPFEPAPFMNPQPHSVRGAGTSSMPRDKWNRVPPRSTTTTTTSGRSRSSANAGGVGSDYGYRRQQQQQQQGGRRKQQKQTYQSQPSGAGSSSSSSPFDNLKDMFSNIKSGRNRKDSDAKKGKVEVDEAKGFKSGNVEVFSSSLFSDDDDGTSSGRQSQTNQAWQRQAMIIDAETLDDDDEEASWQEYNEVEDDAVEDDGFSNAWTGGPKPATTPLSSSSFSTANNNGATETTATPSQNNATGDDNDPIIQKAQELLSTDARIREIVTRAKSHPKIQQAVMECTGNPAAFGLYLDDPEVGPILKELKECVSLLS